jgi:hypothetical protein
MSLDLGDNAASTKVSSRIASSALHAGPEISECVGDSALQLHATAEPKVAPLQYSSEKQMVTNAVVIEQAKNSLPSATTSPHYYPVIEQQALPGAERDIDAQERNPGVSLRISPYVPGSCSMNTDVRAQEYVLCGTREQAQLGAFQHQLGASADGNGSDSSSQGYGNSGGVATDVVLGAGVGAAGAAEEGTILILKGKSSPVMAQIDAVITRATSELERYINELEHKVVSAVAGTGEEVAKNDSGGGVDKMGHRRGKNREHARKSRLRKKLLVVAQQQRMAELERTNHILMEALQQLLPPERAHAVMASALAGKSAEVPKAW